MEQAQFVIDVATRGRAMHEVTREIGRWVAGTGIATGLLTVFCRHTSASLTIQENAAPDVRLDIVDWLDRIAPENAGWRHDDEGPDDMPAHLKSVLTGVSLSVPVAEGRPLLGTWQGIYLVEHRARPHRRQLVLHLIGEPAR
ncbi:secondary thiamine-phosphate synthase enzyme YjbQ [Croceicoccus sp. BE223]|uniref:secondary thiamine-phosphate synthase enzyme YjbQ n=1 Tax=Croceicoccus sp. BE223 TaxID=2817716 RepID=UPI002864A448|nr:secondary thiamine-phosphate synthase enzyme YjbQ [Croceicoccus sp. BE223]MDR7101060.1 secondary thiamine-phosphate synthase enzyme [Croceicoccus sp. BE223]